MKLQGTRILVTGASSGIGRAIAEALGAEGAVLALAGRRAEVLSEVAAAIADAGGTQPVVVLSDLAVAGAAEALVREASMAIGPLDVVVNSAAVEGEGSYGDGAEGDARELFEVDYWAPLSIARAAVPDMRARRTGAIVNVVSLGAITPVPDTGQYPSAKAALAVASEALRAELAGSGVRVIVVYPGFVDTPMLRAFRARPNLPNRWRRSLRVMPIGTAEKLARLVVAALTGRRQTIVYPRAFSLAPHFPSVARRLTAYLFPASATVDDRRVPRAARGAPLLGCCRGSQT